MGNKRNSTAKMRFACAVIFIAFCYTYVACYQADVLAAAQHVLSDGKTDYYYTLSPLLITLVCFLLQVGAYAATGVRRRYHGLTYFPSFLLLALITDVPVRVDEHPSLGWWWVVLPLCLLAWGGAMWVVRQLEPLEQEPHSFGWLSRYAWLNIAQLIVMMLGVLFVGCNDRLFHERMRMEHMMRLRQYDEALEVGRRSLATDSSLTMLRIACLAQTGQMGSRLFTYPLTGGSEAMMPNGTSVRVLMWKAPGWMREPSPWMKKRHLIYKVPDDYKICAPLLDRRLDDFACELLRHYTPGKNTLPTHYKEALLLYCHRRRNPIVEYHDNVMEADLADYQAMERKYADPAERQTALRDTYGNTYWYYYQYGGK